MSEILHVRVEPDIVDMLDACAAQLEQEQGGRVTRSAVARYILRRAKDEPALQAALKEEFATLHAQIAERMGRLQGKIRKLIQDEFKHFPGEPDAG